MFFVCLCRSTLKWLCFWDWTFNFQTRKTFLMSWQLFFLNRFLKRRSVRRSDGILINSLNFVPSTITVAKFWSLFFMGLHIGKFSFVLDFCLLLISKKKEAFPFSFPYEDLFKCDKQFWRHFTFPFYLHIFISIFQKPFFIAKWLFFSCWNSQQVEAYPEPIRYWEKVPENRLIEQSEYDDKYVIETVHSDM